MEGCRIHKGRFRRSFSSFDADSDWCGFGSSQNVALVMPSIIMKMIVATGATASKSAWKSLFSGPHFEK